MLEKIWLELYQWIQQMDLRGADVISTGNPIQMPVGKDIWSFI